MNSDVRPLQISLFETLRDRLGATIDVFKASKATLVDISHTLEDCILNDRLPAVIFTGFQESTYWREETARYLELTGIASQICIFAGGQPPVPEEKHIAVTLSGDDPLRQEWFLLILTRPFSAVLCGQDNQIVIESEANRSFETMLSFDPQVVQAALAAILPVVREYRPDRAAELEAAQAEFPPVNPDGLYMTRIVARVIDHLQRRYDTQSDALSELNYMREQQLRLEHVVSELAVPVVPLLDGVIILPLVGSIDTNRAQQVMESLLLGISERQADVAIIDITGVPVVDTAVANYVFQAVQAARLLGTHVVLTGIGAAMAQTLINLGIDFSAITTRNSLRDGIEAALERLGMQITPLATGQ